MENAVLMQIVKSKIMLLFAVVRWDIEVTPLPTADYQIQVKLIFLHFKIHQNFEWLSF